MQEHFTESKYSAPISAQTDTFMSHKCITKDFFQKIPILVRITLCRVTLALNQCFLNPLFLYWLGKILIDQNVLQERKFCQLSNDDAYCAVLLASQFVYIEHLYSMHIVQWCVFIFAYL